ncbi:MAG: hypothetical protein KDN22_03160 [Verrucomicrobiae bacterium]|nr:hypothetical protein [Verrucomicrobiae bacterium]
MTGVTTSPTSQEARLALHYFASDSNGFWTWNPELDAIVTRQDSTIAFYQEIVAVLRALAPEGFPAFDSIAVFLAACRDNSYDELMEQWSQWAENLPWDLDVDATLDSLSRFHRISSNHRQSAENRAALAAIVFASCTHVVPAADAAQILSFLESRQLAAVGTRTGSLPRMKLALDDMRDGLNALDEDTISIQLQTGIGTTLSSAEIPDIPPATRTQQLLYQLREEDDELSGIAAVALNLMAAVHIPRSIDEPESLPVGGYSDVSNRGTPDRLLITELAQDDDVLATRVNLNEALYLRREAPPRTPLLHRDILVDTGIRLWGIPRVFATALGLAFCATSNERCPLRVFRPCDDENLVEEADFFSKEGLREHLSELTTTAHAGAALRQIIADYQIHHGNDLIVITHADALADPDFQAVVAELSLEKLYIAVVDSSGRYELWLFSRRGKMCLQQAVCSLEKILNPGSGALASVLNPDIDPELPIALRMREFPLLAAHPLHSELAAYHPDIGLAVYLRDGRVVLWQQLHQGGRMLYCPVTKSHVVWIWIEEKQREILLIHQRNELAPLTLTRFPLDGSSTREFACDAAAADSHTAFSYHPRGCLLCSADGREIIALSAQSGQRLCSIELDQLGRLHGRYVQYVSNEWWVLGFGNSTLSKELVPTGDLPKSEILRCFDRDGYEGTHVVLSNGSIFRLSPEVSLVHKMPGGISHVRSISRDGHRVLYVDQSNSLRLLDLAAGRFETIPPRAHHPLQLVEKNVAVFHKRIPQIRKNFRGIGISPDGDLTLVTRNSQLLAVQHTVSQGIIRLQHTGCSRESISEIPFLPIDSPFGEHHSLARADFPDGTRAYLDSRGFLHIVPGDPTLPEAVLALKDGMLSGWFSDGAWFGDRYFIGDHTAIDSASACDRLSHCIHNLKSERHRWKSD